MRFACLIAACFAFAAAIASAHASTVTTQGSQILVDGARFIANGAAGQTRLDDLKKVGATVVRTFGEDPGPVLDAAQRVGLKVIVGFWMGHPRRGFNYADRNAVDTQLDALRHMVERYHTHPALLAWGIGNEVEVGLTPEQSEAVWPAIEQAAHLTRMLDPSHPVMAVLADTGTDKVARLRAMAPSVEILGLNAYGDSLLTITARARAQGWTGPLIVTELGAIGQWQAGVTPWGAPLEPTSTQKADRVRLYLQALRAAKTGAIAFYWGQKQEVTPSWHSLFLPSGEWTETVEALARAWDGHVPGGDNKAPRILSLSLQGPASVGRNQPLEVRLAATDPDGDPLKIQWQVMSETQVTSGAGEPEPIPPSHDQAIHNPSPTGARIEGLEPGHYRVFVVVRDGRGAAATGNIPFEIR